VRCECLPTLPKSSKKSGVLVLLTVLSTCIDAHIFGEAQRTEKQKYGNDNHATDAAKMMVKFEWYSLFEPQHHKIDDVSTKKKKNVTD
jgi:hypothetical protein